MQDDSTVPADVLNELKCDICKRSWKAVAGLKSYLYAHGRAVIHRQPKLAACVNGRTARFIHI